MDGSVFAPNTTGACPEHAIHGGETLMSRLSCLATVLGLLLPASPGAQHRAAPLTPMPRSLEIEFALSALPPGLRQDAAVHVLDPDHGYRPAKHGTSGVTCVVQRTQWELGEFRDDLYVPLCFDAAGTGTYLKAILDTATLRAQGMEASAVKATVKARFDDGTYVPRKPGISYMLAPVMRTIGPPDLAVRTMAMPHLMFYAPGLTNADLGAKPDLADPDSLKWPFVDRQGHDGHSYMIQMAGLSEKVDILAREKPLLDALCTHRVVLCLPPVGGDRANH